MALASPECGRDGDPVATVPIEEVEFNVFAVFVFAEFAFAGVKLEGWCGDLC
jgi:hypothetical protein